MKTAPNPIQNRLLAELTHIELNRLSPFLGLVLLKHGDTLYQANGTMAHVYFPITATISVDYLLNNGGTSEITRIGNEGMLGVSLFMGSQHSTGRAVVQQAGYAYCLSATRMMEELEHSGPLLRILLRYTQSRLMQVSQLVTCNSHHTTKQRLCRYLLEMLDRTSSNVILVKQEEIASILGVRREGVTDAARILRELGIISWRRGHVIILRRVGLNEHVCECYAVISRDTSMLLPDQPILYSGIKYTWHEDGTFPPYHFVGRERRKSYSSIIKTDIDINQSEFSFE